MKIRDEFIQLLIVHLFQLPDKQTAQTPPGGSCMSDGDCPGSSKCQDGWCICPEVSMKVINGSCEKVIVNC